MDEPTLARFMAKVNKTETCWLWIASKVKNRGYGRFELNEKAVLTHRLSYLHHHGEIQKGLVVRHKCRNRHCVNPDHLELGTQKENIQDCLRDGTMILGEKCPSSKLTKAQVLDIRSRIGGIRKEIAEEFGVTKENIGQIINRRSWKHL